MFARSLWGAHPGLPSLEQLLLEGGDARIALDQSSGLNKYACQSFPDPDLAAFGSSTASTISEAGFSAASGLRDKLLLVVDVEQHAVVYARELNRIRQELVRLCGVSDLPGLNVIFAPSGTDIHLIAAQLAGGTEAAPTLAVMVEAAETGSGVGAALSGHHFSARAALGGAVIEGTPIGGGVVCEAVTVPIRLADGTPRQSAAVDTEVEALVAGAIAKGRRVLLTLVDVSKTGLIAPSPACVLALHHRFPDRVDVLVDACQFRIAPPTLRAYLEQGFMVALTGSKFVTGPTFSGALLIPSPAAQRLRQRSLPHALSAYSARADWPQGWDTDDALDDVANFGLLLRWEAALADLRAFRSLPEAAVMNFVQTFAQAVQNRLMSDPVFEPLPVPRLDRIPLIEATGWDHIQTIFPFLLHHSEDEDKTLLSREETEQVYRLLQADLTDSYGLDCQASSNNAAALRCQLGQPISCGSRDGLPVSALRLCVSARLVVEATSGDGRHASDVIERALAALDKTALLVRAGRQLRTP
ncbi:MAG TPA: hypothetical protein VMV75_04160 [Sulfuricella sp.]|nr:hypothetical protein [Sulfuricella sp.]